MIPKNFASNFEDSTFNIMPFIQQWPKELDKAAIAKWICFKQASMIFVPVLRNPDDENKEVISKKFFYCSKCNQWKKHLNLLKILKGMF